VICQVLCHGRNTDGESHRFTGDSNPEEMFSKVSESCFICPQFAMFVVNTCHYYTYTHYWFLYCVCECGLFSVLVLYTVGQAVTVKSFMLEYLLARIYCNKCGTK